MASVIVTWRGACSRRDVQDELLLHLRTLALRHEAAWADDPPYRPPFLEKLTAHRAADRPAHANIRLFDQDLTGRILVRTDVTTDREALLDEATQHGIPYERENDRPDAHGLLHLDQLRVRGLDFRLFDPRRLYPGADRLSFLFLESEQAPFLTGRLAAVDERDFCARSQHESIRQADWYVQCPYVHLRYYLEDWLDLLLGWVRFFFIPGLHYRRYDDLPAYARWQSFFQTLQETTGYEKARALIFDKLLRDFEEEAQQWNAYMNSLAPGPTLDSVRLVLPDWEMIHHGDETRVWQDDAGDGLALHLEAPSPLAAVLDDLDAVRRTLRAEAAEAGGGLVEADVVKVGGLPAVRSILKRPQQPSGMTYEGTLLLPRRDFSFAATVLCRETGRTGLRDTTVYLRLAADYGPPDGRPDDWFKDPYDPAFEGRVLRNPADDAEWDALFPNHPLARCRTHLRMLAERLSWKDDVKTAPAS